MNCGNFKSYRGMIGRGFAALVIVSVIQIPASARAASAPVKAKTATAPAVASKTVDANKGFRKKELNFEERVIEGLSNKGYESLSQTGSSDGLKGEKLYRKRAEFDEDSKSLLREMEYLK